MLHADKKRTEEVISLYKMNYRIDKVMVDSFLENHEKLKSYEEEMVSLIQKNTEEDNLAAFSIYEEGYTPLLEETAQLFKEVDVQQEELAHQQIESARRMFWIIVIVIVVSIMIGSIVLTKKNREIITGIIKPLDEIEKAAAALSEGDFSLEIGYMGEDELGKVCKSIQTSFIILKKMIQEMRDCFEEWGHGNLKVYPSMTFPGELRNIEIYEEKLICKLNEAFGKIRSSVEMINVGSLQFSSAAQDLAEGATSQMQSMQSVSQNFTEIAGQIQNTSKEAEEVDRLVKKTGEITVNSQEKMEDMLQAMEKSHRLRNP